MCLLPNLLAGRGSQRAVAGKSANRKKLAEALLPLLANGKTSNTMHVTFVVHQQIRCNADERAADAV